jgi:hypothetical protein
MLWCCRGGWCVLIGDLALCAAAHDDDAAAAAAAFHAPFDAAGAMRPPPPSPIRLKLWLCTIGQYVACDV